MRALAPVKDKLSEQIVPWLSVWESEVKDAITVAQMPDEEESHVYWLIALAGNMLWASTCLLAPSAAAGAAAIAAAEAAELGVAVAEAAGKTAAALRQAAIVTMSGGGAAIGSGTAEKLAEAGKIAVNLKGNSVWDVKRVLGQITAEKADDLEQLFRGRTLLWANELYEREGDSALQDGNVVFDELAKQYVWSKMFPRVPFESKRGAILSVTRNSVERLLQDFNRQWEEWSSRVEEHWAMLKATARVGRFPGMTPDPGPFQPKLKFDDLAR